MSVNPRGRGRVQSRQFFYLKPSFRVDVYRKTTQVSDASSFREMQLRTAVGQAPNHVQATISRTCVQSIPQLRKLNAHCRQIALDRVSTVPCTSALALLYRVIMPKIVVRVKYLKFPTDGISHFITEDRFCSYER